MQMVGGGVCVLEEHFTVRSDERVDRQPCRVDRWAYRGAPGSVRLRMSLVYRRFFGGRLPSLGVTKDLDCFAPRSIPSSVDPESQR